MHTASWVVISKSTENVLFETYERTTMQAVNRNLYRVVPIHKHLANLNRVRDCFCDSRDELPVLDGGVA